MAYLEFIDDLSKWLKIILAFILNPLFIVYRFIDDIRQKAWLLIIFDVLFCIEFYVVFWILNIIWIIKDNKVFSFATWFGIDDPGKWAKTNNVSDDVIEAEVVDK